MTLDLRGLSFVESFEQIRIAIELSGFSKGEIVAFIEPHENEKCRLLKLFAESVLDCKPILEEANGLYILKIMSS